MGDFAPQQSDICKFIPKLLGPHNAAVREQEPNRRRVGDSGGSHWSGPVEVTGADGEADMLDLSALAVGATPIAGGALLAVAAGQLKPSNRSMSKDFLDRLKLYMDLLERIPEEQTARRAELQHMIDSNIDDIVALTKQSRALRAAASSYKGDWRDIVLFACAVLLTMLWWTEPHSRSDWIPTFIVLIIVSVLTAVYALRGVFRSLAKLRRRADRIDHPKGN